MKPSLSASLSSLASLLSLPTLTNLHTIQVIACNSSGSLIAALSSAGVNLPNVHTVIICDKAYGILSCCPNARKVRCISGSGRSVIYALQYCKCEVFEGCVDWLGNPMLMDR
jgi:hypothetical protein